MNPGLVQLLHLGLREYDTVYHIAVLVLQLVEKAPDQLGRLPVPFLSVLLCVEGLVSQDRSDALLGQQRLLYSG